MIMGRRCSSRCECRGPAVEHADAVRKAAKELRASAVEYRRREPEMYRMLVADARDLRQVASLIQQGRYREAYKLACHMDTAAREHIPHEAWDFLTYRNR